MRQRLFTSGAHDAESAATIVVASAAGEASGTIHDRSSGPRTSVAPLFAVATTGVPHASASRVMRPKPSSATLGRTTQSAALEKTGKSASHDGPGDDDRVG